MHGTNIRSHGSDWQPYIPHTNSWPEPLLYVCLNKSHNTDQARTDTAVDHPLSPMADVNNLTLDTSLQEIIKQLEEN